MADQPPAASARPVFLHLADVRAGNGRLIFTATLDARAPDLWTGQDWVLVPIDASPWGLPALRPDGLPAIKQWFAGQAAAGAATTTHSYVLDAGASSLAVRGADGAFAAVQASAREPTPGNWMLALRLTRKGDRGIQEIVVIAPVLRFEVASDGTVSSPQVYDTSLGWKPA